MHMGLLPAALALLSAFAFAGSPEAHRDSRHLAPGGYAWHPEISPTGPIVVVVSLDEQRVYVYRNGIAIGVATISSGRRGHETPPGIYTILEKDRDHHSNKYDNAPMPYMERLTWDGVALHGGQLPGYPASHGCVRLPAPFAELLFSITQRGETVVVAHSSVSPAAVVHPAVLAPVSALGQPVDESSDQDFTWQEPDVPDGPVSILVSIGDRRVYVMRNGVRIGTAALDVADGFAISGTLLLVVGDGYDDRPSPLDPERPRHRWSAYSIGSMTTAALPIDALSAHLHVPDRFARMVYSILAPGTTVIVTELPGIRPQRNSTRSVLESEFP